MPGTVRVPDTSAGAPSAIVDPGGSGDYTELNAACAGEAAGAVIALRPGTYTESADIQVKAGQSLIGMSSLEDANPGVLVDMGDNLLDLVTNSAIGSRIEGIYFRFTPTTDEFKIQLGAVADDSIFRDLVFDFTPGAAAHSGIQDLSDRNRWYNITILCNNSTDAPLEVYGSDCAYEDFRFTGGNTTGVPYINAQNGNRNTFKGFNVTGLAAGGNEVLMVRDLAGNFDYNKFSDFYIDAGGFAGRCMRIDADHCQFNNFTLRNSTSQGLYIRQTLNLLTNFTIEGVAVGILFDSTAIQNQFENFLIYNTTNRGIQAGATACKFSNFIIAASGGTYSIDMDGNAVRNEWVNITCDNLVEIEAPDQRFTNCSFEELNVLATALECTFSACRFSGTVDVADGADRCMFVGCDADGTVNITGDNTVISGCQIQTLNTAVTANVNGVLLSGTRVSLFTNGNPNNANFTRISCCTFGTFNDTGGFSTIRDEYTEETVVGAFTVRGSRHYNNEGAAGDIVGTLPAAPIDGTRVLVTIMNGNRITLDAAAGDFISIGSASSAAGGTVDSNTPYSIIELVAHTSGGVDRWIATKMIGTWTLT